MIRPNEAASVVWHVNDNCSQL